jgi:phenylacetate-CoA ligase
MSRRTLGTYVSELRRRKPPWIHGYPSLLALLAAYLSDTGTDLGYELKWVTTGAETLLPQQSTLIQDAFGVRPRQHYGMSEAVANFSECERGLLHVDEDFAAVEFLPVVGSDRQRIVGTNLTNPITPLIRYETGDEATVAPFACQCGRPGRAVHSIDGRVEDYVVLPDGRRLGRLDHVFKDVVNVHEAQIVQRAVGELILRIVRGTRYTPNDEHEILGAMAERIGPETMIRIEYVPAVERSRTGKLRFVISELAEGRIDCPGI